MSGLADHRLIAGPATVLVVDDEPHVRGLISRWLADAGHCCLQAASADQAVARLRDHEVHFATLDINMPGRSGLELLTELKVISPDTEAIMLSARGDASTAIAALTQGARGYLIKPVEREDILFHLRSALEHRRLVVENRRYMQELEERVRQQTVAIRKAHEETIHRLVTVAMYRDEETGAHIRRTGLFSSLLAAAAGWPSTEVDQIRMAAPMHDVGKVGIPDAILCKTDRLTREEYAIMQRHTLIGAEMLAEAEPPMLRMAHQIALCHHEHWDGSGYPRGLSGEAIPEAARIVAIADVYDALTHDRVYRAALPEEQALAIMRAGQGSHFDPLLLTQFFTLLPELEQIARENPDEGVGLRYRAQEEVRDCVKSGQ
jgi:putative two-component system response regulator